MNYQKIYNDLIDRAKNRILPKNIYVERHHIQPRCMKGKDISENLVKLLAREHFIAHLLLCKIYPNNISLIRAVIYMCIINNDHKGNRINNKIYDWIRKKFAIQQSKFMKKNNPIKKLSVEDEKKRVLKMKRTFKLNKEKGLHKKSIFSIEERKKRSKRIKKVITKEIYKKQGKNHKNKIWVNNGDIMTYIVKQEIPKFLENGFSLGMIKRKHLNNPPIIKWIDNNQYIINSKYKQKEEKILFNNIK